MPGQAPEAIRNLKTVVVGAGSAGIGVAQSLRTAMMQAGAPSEAAASQNFYVFDRDGLVGQGRTGLTDEQMSFARTDLPDGMSIEEVVELAGPELVLGLSGRKGTIPESAVRAMAAKHARPIVMPLSNPTSVCEVTPVEAYEWTDGRAIVATGSPFEPVSRPGGVTLTPSQCNNMCARAPPRRLAARSSPGRPTAPGIYSRASGLAQASAPQNRCPTRCSTPRLWLFRR